MDITTGTLGVVLGLTGGIDDTPAVGAVTVEAGVTVNGNMGATLGPVLGGLTGLGAGILTTGTGAQVTNDGTILGTGTLLPVLGGGRRAAST